MTSTDDINTRTDDLNSDRLARIRKLLAKAEASNYPEEAEAFMEKVSELIARWGVDEALVWAAAAPGERAAPIDARIHVPAPYAARKAVLIGRVAAACGCKCVRHTGPEEYVSLIGFEGDVRRAEMLSTSLMMQLTRDMLKLSPEGTSPSGTAAWRRSFIIGFADRIGERLEAARSTAANDTTTTDGSSDAEADAPAPRSAALVLIDRDAAVTAAMKEKFPRLRTSYVSAGRSRAGTAAGRESASRADIGTKNLSGSRAAIGA